MVYLLELGIEVLVGINTVKFFDISIGLGGRRRSWRADYSRTGHPPPTRHRGYSHYDDNDNYGYFVHDFV